MIRTLTVVGGGSAYAPGLVAAIIHHAGELALREIRLFDIDAEHLAVVAKLCDGLARVAGVDLRVRGVDRLDEAVEGADVVLNSSRPGGFPCRRIDETVPLDAGVPGQETVGPGGFFFALRSVPEAMKLASVITRRAPAAVFLNYTNPTNIVTQALVDRRDVDVVGMCDQSDEDLQAIAESLGREGAPYDFRCIGLNHATWYSDIRLGGRPLSPLPTDTAPPEHYDREHKLRFALSQRMCDAERGLFPNSYLPYYEEPERFVELSREVGPRTDAILATLESYYQHFREEADKEHPVLRRHRGSSGFGDLAVSTLIALGRAEPSRLVLNVANRGASADFADDTVIETHVELSSSGVARSPAPAVPERSRERLAALERYQRGVARAAAAGDLEDATRALAENPLVDSVARARDLVARARAAYGDRIAMLDSR